MHFLADQNKSCLFYESGTYANTSGPAVWIGQVTEDTPDESVGLISQRYVGQGDRNVGMFLEGPITFTNKMTFNVQDFRFMKFLLGSCIDGGSPSPYEHRYAESNNNMQTLEIPGQSLPSFGIETAQTATTGSNFIRTFKGGMIDTLTLTIAEREPIVADMTYAAKSVTFSSGAATACTQDATKPYMWSNTQVHWESGNVLPNVKEISVEVNNNLDQPHYVDGDRVIGTPLPTMRDYTVTLTLNADDTNLNTNTVYNQYFMGGMIAGSQFNMIVDMVISTGSEQGIWTLSGCRVEAMTTPSPNEGVNEQTITIRPQSSSFIEYNTTQYVNAWSGAGF